MTSVVEQLANAALARDAIQVRSLAQELCQSSPLLSDLEQPTTIRPKSLIVAAALVELLAIRKHVAAPAWALAIGGFRGNHIEVEAEIVCQSTVENHDPRCSHGGWLRRSEKNIRQP